jgi:hypothetical protein
MLTGITLKKAFYTFEPIDLYIELIKMAKPIRATPSLKGQEAIDFILNMQKREKSKRISKMDLELIELINENKRVLRV